MYVQFLQTSEVWAEFTIDPSVPSLNSSFTALQPVDTTFLQSYFCQQRNLKSGITLLIAVVAADYAFIVGAYSLVIWGAGLFQKKQNDGNSPIC